jgi:quercetin dioxygenase-like cupin family protein
VRRACLAASAIIVTLAISSALARQADHRATPLDQIPFAPDDDVKCLSSAVLRGDPGKGPSTLILKAPSGCLVAWHYHTAREELMVASGEVRTEMDGMAPTMLGAGGYASMASKQPHQFTCSGKAECVMFVTFDSVYDITWGK